MEFQQVVQQRRMVRAFREQPLAPAVVERIRASRLRYRRRRDLLVARLGPGPDQPLPGLKVHGVAAGLHALITLPTSGPDEHTILTACTHRGIALRGLAELWHTRGNHPHSILVGYAAAAERAYPTALDALAGLLADLGRHHHSTGA